MNNDEITMRVFLDLGNLIRDWQKDKIPDEEYLDRCLYRFIAQMVQVIPSKEKGRERLTSYFEDAWKLQQDINKESR